MLGLVMPMESSSRCSDAVTFKPMYRNPRLLRTICFFHACLSSWQSKLKQMKTCFNCRHGATSPESPRASRGSCPRTCKRAEKTCYTCGNTIGNIWRASAVPLWPIIPRHYQKVIFLHGKSRKPCSRHLFRRVGCGQILEMRATQLCLSERLSCAILGCPCEPGDNTPCTACRRGRGNVSTSLGI